MNFRDRALTGLPEARPHTPERDRALAALAARRAPRPGISPEHAVKMRTAKQVVREESLRGYKARVATHKVSETSGKSYVSLSLQEVAAKVAVGTGCLAERKIALAILSEGKQKVTRPTKARTAHHGRERDS